MILKQQDLMPVQTYKPAKKITNFCLNEEVYRSLTASAANKNVSQIDQICYCSNNTLNFLKADFVTGIYKFTEETQPNLRKGYLIGCTPDQLIWDGDKIYISARRDKAGGILNIRAGESEEGSYTILDYNTGDILSVLNYPQGTPAFMSVLNEKLLVVTQHGTRANFMTLGPDGSKQGVLARSPYFVLERQSGNAT